MARELKLRTNIVRKDIRAVSDVLRELSDDVVVNGPGIIKDGVELIFYKDNATGITVQITKEEV